MATGTGKTVVAFQVCWKLWNARWNRTGEYRRPKILYLADRNILKDFEHVVALRARTEAIARRLTEFLKKTDRLAKTIVFCVDQEHASEMRQALSNLNHDLVAKHPDYVCRVTADEGDMGRDPNGETPPRDE